MCATICLHSGSAITNTRRKLDHSDGNMGSCGTCENSKNQAFVYLTVVYRWQSANVSRRSKHCGYFWLFLTLQNTEQQNWSWAPACFSSHIIFWFLYFKGKGVSHTDALWMITPNWSVNVHYACLDLAPSCALRGCIISQFHDLSLAGHYFCSWIVKQ